MIQPELPHLPTQADYLKAAIDVDKSFRENGGAENAITEHLTRIAQGGRRYNSFFGMIGQLARIVEPMDRSTGTTVDESGDGSRTLMQGSAAGLLVVERAHAGLIRPQHVFEKLPVALPAKADDLFEAHHKFSSEIRSVGTEGVTLIGEEAAAVVEEWENDVVYDVRRQQLFRIGLGIVALGAYGFHKRLITEEREHAEMEAFRQEIHTFHDWDAEAARLFNTGS